MIKFKLSGTKELLEDLDPKRVGKVVTRTINKVTAQANTAMSRKVREVYNIKAKDFSAKIRVIKASDGQPFAVIQIRDSQGVPLLSFSARQTKRGVTYKVKKAEGNKRVDSAFIATMQSGHSGVFERYGEKVRPKRGRYVTMRTRKSKPILRQPLQELYRIDAVGMVDQQGLDEVQRVVSEKMSEIFNHEFQWEFGK